MDQESIKQLLEDVAAGRSDVLSAVEKLRRLPFESVGFANIDHHRGLRCGMPEVIYGPGKTTEQIVSIFEKLAAAGANVMVTRTDEVVFGEVRKNFPQAVFEAAARAIVLKQNGEVSSLCRIAVVTAGTSDIPVAEEARVTAELLNQSVKTIYDVGVAGLHRLLAHSELLQSVQVIVVVAGMEGALASVVGGMVDVPVIAVPTSVGYGANLGGIAPLLTMLNSCAAGVSVVNIDNGFAAGVIAATISRQIEKASEKSVISYDTANSGNSVIAQAKI